MFAFASSMPFFVAFVVMALADSSNTIVGFVCQV